MGSLAFKNSLNHFIHCSLSIEIYLTKICTNRVNGLGSSPDNCTFFASFVVAPSSAYSLRLNECVLILLSPKHAPLFSLQFLLPVLASTSRLNFSRLISLSACKASMPCSIISRLGPRNHVSTRNQYFLQLFDYKLDLNCRPSR